jgi:hypothetical protein
LPPFPDSRSHHNKYPRRFSHKVSGKARTLRPFDCRKDGSPTE